MNDDKIRDFIYRHEAASRSRGPELADKVVRWLNAADKDIDDELAKRYSRIEANGFDAGPATTKHLEDLKKGLGAINAKVYKKIAAGITADLVDIAQAESEFAARAAKAAGAPIKLGTTVHSAEFLKTLVTTTQLPFSDDGVTRLMPWLNRQEAWRLEKLEAAIQQGIGQGETTASIAKRVQGILGNSKRDATTIALTANSAIQNQSRLETFKKMKSVRYVEWSSIKDSRTSTICMSRSGTVYPIDAPFPKPPAHPRCRSILLPRQDNEGTKHQEYGAWLKGQPAAVQDKVLNGKARADIFRSNPDMDFKAFFDERSQFKTLDQLRAHDDAMFGNKERAKAEPKAPAKAAPEPEIIDTMKLDKEARDYVIETGRRTGIEHLVAYDENTGREIERMSGDKSSVSFSPRLVEAIRDKRNAIVLHHNHPRSSSLSWPDVHVLTSNAGARSIYAHGHNASEFFAERGALALKKSTVDAISEAIVKALQGLIGLRIINIEDAQLLHQHLVWLAVHKVGQITYRASLAGESAAAWERNAAIYTRVLESLE